MAETSPEMPRLTPEQRRNAVMQFERAKQALKKGGEPDYPLVLLLPSCELDPANLVYRKELRKPQREKYKNNGSGQSLAWLRSLMGRLRLRNAIRQEKYLEALVLAEQILMRNPWEIG